VSDRITVGMAGLGGWGKHLLRNFGTLPEADLRWCCDADEGTRARYAAAYPDARFTPSYETCWPTQT
jgi:predicted dehydrogenase